MTIFDIISDILYTKNKSALNNIDDEAVFSPFLTNRWLSMYNSNIAKISNTVNKFIGIFDNKKDLYSLFVAVFPKMPVRKINYIKKTKEEKDTESEELYKHIAKNKELSVREVREYSKILNLQ